MDDTVYTFVEHLSAYKYRTLFACIALDIEEAGELYEKKIGTSPWKMKYVSCGFVNRYTYL